MVDNLSIILFRFSNVSFLILAQIGYLKKCFHFVLKLNERCILC